MKVVAIAVSMVITTLRILPQRVLLLKVPMFVMNTDWLVVG